MVVPLFKVKREEQIGVLVLGMGSEHSSERPLRHVLNFSFYDTSSHIDALRYIRNIRIHFRDAPKDLKTGRTMLNNHYVKQQNEAINLEEKYIEQMTAQIFDRFIVYLYFAIHQLRYHF